jgi:hypothetical protein
MRRTHRKEQVLDALLLSGLLIGGSLLARRATTEAWKLLSDDPPPDPDDPDEDLREVLMFSLISGVLVGLVRLLLRRNFARKEAPTMIRRIRRRLP